MNKLTDHSKETGVTSGIQNSLVDALQKINSFSAKDQALKVGPRIKSVQVK